MQICTSVQNTNCADTVSKSLPKPQNNCPENQVIKFSSLKIKGGQIRI
jgi:hypothetical protein